MVRGMTGEEAYAASMAYVKKSLEGAGALKGEKGDPGKDGYTPIKGTDYWTETDVSNIVNECKSYIDSELLGGAS